MTWLPPAPRVLRGGARVKSAALLNGRGEYFIGEAVLPRPALRSLRPCYEPNRVGRAYETLRVGQAGVEGYVWDVRLVCDRADKSQHHVVSATASLGPFDSLASALAYCATTWSEVAWRESLQVGTDEGPCPVCEAPLRASPRYPLAVCPVCVLEAVDAKGLEVRFFNTTAMGGGFEARHADGRGDDDHVCFVRGIPCRANEAYFGGIVVEAAVERRNP